MGEPRHRVQNAKPVLKRMTGTWDPVQTAQYQLPKTFHSEIKQGTTLVVFHRNRHSDLVEPRPKKEFPPGPRSPLLNVKVYPYY